MGGLEYFFHGFVDVEAPLDAAVLKGIPAKRGVFLLAAAGDRPVLLTTAADIRGRLRFRLSAEEEGRRTKTADLREITTRVYWRLAYSAFETDWRFLELARAIWPDTYPALLSFQPAWFVAVDPQEPFPQFLRTRDVAGAQWDSRALRGQARGRAVHRGPDRRLRPLPVLPYPSAGPARHAVRVQTDGPLAGCRATGRSRWTSTAP